MADTLTLAWRQYRLERRLFWRNPSAAFFNFLLPLLFLAFFGAIFHSNQHELNVIVPGIAGMSVMSTTFVALAYNMTFLREEGVLKRIRGTPMSGTSYLGAIAANAIARNLLIDSLPAHRFRSRVRPSYRRAACTSVRRRSPFPPWSCSRKCRRA